MASGGSPNPNGAPWPTQYVIAMGGYSAMTGTETIRRSAAVWAVRRGSNRRRAAESSAWIERMTREEQPRVREDLAKNGSAVPGLYLG
jgi:hypothetical protein